MPATNGGYPSAPGKPITRKGNLSYKTEYPRTQEYADFFVDEQIMNNIWMLIHQWEDDPPYFAIPVNDCVSFVYRVCAIMGLRYNPFALFPASAIRDICNVNSRYAIYRGNVKAPDTKSGDWTQVSGDWT